MRKTHKVQAYYPVMTGGKPNSVYCRHFIHSQESQGLWATIRDLSQKEILTNDAAEKQQSLYITIGYNPAVLKHWRELILIDEQGTTYKIKTKPDEFSYERRDIRIAAYAFVDNSAYTGADIYDGDKSTKG